MLIEVAIVERFDTMPKDKPTKVTIELSPEEHNLLSIIKSETGDSLRTLVKMGVPLLIKNKENILMKVAENANSKSDMIKETLSKL